MKTLDLYIRVSRVGGREGESFQSPSQQEAAMRRAVEALGYGVGEVNKTDLDESGGTVDRPGFQRILRRIETGQVDGMAVIRADRFARSITLAWECIWRIQAADGIFLSASEHVDILSASGRLQFNIIMSMAQYQRESAKEGWETAQRNALARGVYLARAPVGYMRLTNDRGRAYGPLVPNPAEAPYVVEVFRRRGEGETLTALARYLTAHVESRKGDRWTISAVRSILANRCYRGEAGHRRHKGNPDAHEALVTEAEWQAANRSRGVRSTGDGGFLLAGLVRCAGCRYRMKPQTNTSRGRKFHYYRCCASWERASTCSCASAVRARELEDYITARVFERHEVMLKGLSGGVDVERTATELREAEDAYAEFGRMAAKSKRPALMESALEDAERRVLEAEAEHARVQGLGQEPGVPGLFPLREWWPDMPLDKRRRAVAGLIDCVFIRGLAGSSEPLSRRLRIFWRGTAPDDLPGSGKFVAPRPFEWDEVEVGEPLAEEVGEDALKRASFRDET